MNKYQGQFLVMLGIVLYLVLLMGICYNGLINSIHNRDNTITILFLAVGILLPVVAMFFSLGD